MSAEIKKFGGVTHAYFECQDCKKEFSSYKNGQALAAQHARKYRHLVVGDVGLSFKYDGRPQP